MVTPAELRGMLAGEQFSSWFRSVTEVALIRIPAWLAGLADWSEDVIRDAGGGRQPMWGSGGRLPRQGSTPRR
jgi:hypothetical protein